MSQSKLRDFYRELVGDHSGELYQYAYRNCGNEALAEDLVAETFTEAWKSLKNLRKRESARAWLFQIFRFRFYHYLRESKKKPDRYAMLEGDELNGLTGRELDEEYALKDSLQSALDLLEVRFKEPFLLVFLEGYSCKEAAEVLEIPIGTVLSRIYRARKFLKTALKDFADIGFEKKKAEEMSARIYPKKNQINKDRAVGEES